MATGHSVCDITEPEKKKIKDWFIEKGVDGIKNYIEKRFNEWKGIPLNIAVTGTSGVGKSSYINAIRGLQAYEEGGAAVGVEETTTTPKPYPHPKHNNLIFWDLPGVGTSRFPKETYLEQVEFKKHDVFLILCSKRFTENDLWLVGRVREQNKQFYCVRTGIDMDISNHMKTHPKRAMTEEKAEEEVIDIIRKGFVKQLGSNTDVFLINNFDINRFDFKRMFTRLINDASDLKKEAMILAFSPLTDEVILQKRDSILKRVSRLSSVCQVAVVIVNAPLNFIGFSGLHSIKAVEKLVIKRILSEANEFHEQFGLADSDLNICADSLNISVEDLRQKWNIRNYQPTFLKSDLLSKVADSQNTFVIFPILNLFENVFVSEDFQILLEGFRTVLDEMIEDAKKVIHEKCKLLITSTE